MFAGMVRLLDAIDKSRKCHRPLNRILTNTRKNVVSLFARCRSDEASSCEDASLKRMLRAIAKQ